MIWALEYKVNLTGSSARQPQKGWTDTEQRALQGAAAMGSRNCYARAAAARGNVARRWRYTPTYGWSQLHLFWGGGGGCLSQSYQTGWSALKPGQTIVQASKGQVREKQNDAPSPTPRASPMFFPEEGKTHTVAGVTHWQLLLPLLLREVPYWSR